MEKERIEQERRAMMQDQAQLRLQNFMSQPLE
jgi:hypothetical protein